METHSKTCLKLSRAQESHAQEDHGITETDEIFVHWRRQQSIEEPAFPSFMRAHLGFSGIRFQGDPRDRLKSTEKS